MRRPLVAGNWKMNLDRAAAVKLARDVAIRAEALRDRVDVALCPPSLYLDPVAAAIRGTSTALGAQNMYFQPNGAFTGEISAAMLIDLGCRYVILGHSERRHILGETDELIQQKVQAALAAGLAPIVCVGELLAQRESGHTAAVVRRQFDGSLAGVAADDAMRITLAYEPVWAIGTGRTATPDVAEAVHADLRKLLADCYNADVAAGVRILYGGSVSGKNAAELLAQPNVDGALVGGASLKAEEFLSILYAAADQADGQRGGVA
jgi:triosephosphate isomerase